LTRNGHPAGLFFDVDQCGIRTTWQENSVSAAQEHAVVGETPNLAARPQALADPGAEVIAASTLS
jgi:class 3 adenylate cyclase